MLYIKCVLTGVAVMALTCVLYVYGFYIFFVRPRLTKLPPGTAIGIDPRAILGPLFWIIAAIGFAAGFFWRFRGGSS